MFAKSPTLTVAPCFSQADEKVAIRIDGLGSLQQVTVVSRAASSSGRPFLACAQYTADNSGVVDLQKAESVGGDYTGVEPMGLFWAMRLPEADRESYSWFRITDADEVPVTITVYCGHREEKEVEKVRPIATRAIVRRYISESTEVTTFRAGRVRGTLYAPNDGEKHHGVIDMAGVGGAYSRCRAALLAGHGYTVLSLAYHGWSDLPPTLEFVDVDYFEEAVEYFTNHSRVRKGGVSVMGDSVGGSIALIMAACIPEVIRTVSINGMLFIPFPIKHKAKIWRKVDEVKFGPDRDHWVYLPMPKLEDIPKHMPAFQNSKADLLFINGEDDGVLDWKAVKPLLKSILKSGGKSNYKILSYPGTGHKVEPPYGPVTIVTYLRKSDKGPVDFGGNTKDHAKAQEKSWIEILDFLANGLRPNCKL